MKRCCLYDIMHGVIKGPPFYYFTTDDFSREFVDEDRMLLIIRTYNAKELSSLAAVSVKRGYNFFFFFFFFFLWQRLDTQFGGLGDGVNGHSQPSL